MMTGAKFEKLVEIMAALRGPNGCPWDKEQTFDSLKPMMVEEIYEVIEAIDNQDFEHLSEELALRYGPEIPVVASIGKIILPGANRTEPRSRPGIAGAAIQ